MSKIDGSSQEEMLELVDFLSESISDLDQYSLVANELIGIRKSLLKVSTILSDSDIAPVNVTYARNALHNLDRWIQGIRASFDQLETAA